MRSVIPLSRNEFDKAVDINKMVLGCGLRLRQAETDQIEHHDRWRMIHLAGI